jgi:predicted secreted Zn-dependent protease
MLASAPALALEKCVGTDGKVTYSDTRCATGAKRSTVSGGASIGDARLEYYDVSTPGGHAAHASWQLSYQYRSRPLSGGSCAVDSVTTKLELKVSMPRWTPSAQAAPDLVTRWSRYLSALEVHENGHLQTGRDFESNFKRTAMATTAANCSTLDGALRATFDSLLKQAKARDIDYDAQTGHGAMQGAVFR